MTVTFLRHAISAFNENGVDLVDCPLSDRGFEQVDRLELCDFDLILCSPLLRARQTCSRYMYTTEPLVRERVTDRCDTMAGERFRVEPESDVWLRIATMRTKLIELSERYENILVVSHADFIWYYTSNLVYDGDDGRELRCGKWLDNCEMVGLLENK